MGNAVACSKPPTRILPETHVQYACYWYLCSHLENTIVKVFLSSENKIQTTLVNFVKKTVNAVTLVAFKFLLGDFDE